MEIERIETNYITVARMGDQKLYSESAFMYELKSELNALGYNLIKTLMYKDAHLVPDTQYYLRSKNIKSKTALCIYDICYAVRDIADDYNTLDSVTLCIDRNLEKRVHNVRLSETSKRKLPLRRIRTALQSAC